ncbi:uncharacterized protein AB675_10681 [Cyphellophora attinorum]|uniref:Uncharacterized protein n=1 Tax=Cyphellophora attinorum TaxID=1664694 RepID=A0A0N1HAK7_9EURO|nr:uncharacterized protein AB675_10681 [Phialophora attinorum]KPI40910.1 hypothetical protein AB675_10681 [Phialophora attinorum]
MIPPPQPSLLENNPHFATLHKTLITKYLEHDASSRARNEDYEGTADHLRALRERLARERLLLGALSSVAGGRGAGAVGPEEAGTGQVVEDVDHETAEEGSVLTKEDMGLVGLMVQYIASAPDLSAEEHGLMRQDLATFRSMLSPELGTGQKVGTTSSASPLSAQLSALLIGMEGRLRRNAMVSCDASSTPASSSPPSGPSSAVDVHLQHLLSHSRGLHAHTLPNALLNLAASTTSLLRSNSTTLTRSRLPRLESTVYGAASEARSFVARADFDKAVARGLRAKGEVMLKELERDGAVDGDAVLTRLDAEEQVLQERKEQLRKALGEYESAERDLVNDAGGPTRATVLKKLGRRYGEIESEILEVTGDIDRLQVESDGSTRGARTER